MWRNQRLCWDWDTWLSCTSCIWFRPWKNTVCSFILFFPVVVEVSKSKQIVSDWFGRCRWSLSRLQMNSKCFGVSSTKCHTTPSIFTSTAIALSNSQLVYHFRLLFSCEKLTIFSASVQSLSILFLWLSFGVTIDSFWVVTGRLNTIHPKNQ